ncbi:hypothetical protein EVAR_75364_1 [Eumeta japonica]|uniref:Uncharacterized protein n=1 Tax=Eumeta variegata TaxID=151549 RepID=A0A4C1YEI8_EUMVA|nr:hypothetical protein EVAR_75364_1 [Eumeta japonica]
MFQEEISTSLSSPAPALLGNCARRIKQSPQPRRQTRALNYWIYYYSCKIRNSAVVYVRPSNRCVFFSDTPITLVVPPVIRTSTSPVGPSGFSSCCRMSSPSTNCGVAYSSPAGRHTPRLGYRLLSLRNENVTTLS